jgi:hypothetical protein
MILSRPELPLQPAGSPTSHTILLTVPRRPLNTKQLSQASHGPVARHAFRLRPVSAEGGAGDLGQVADGGAFADPHDAFPSGRGRGLTVAVVGVVRAAGDVADGAALGVAGCGGQIEAPGARVVPVLNVLGSVKYEELFVVYRSINQLLREAEITVVDPEIGEFSTSFDMAGCSLTLFWLGNERGGELEQLWTAPADTPSFRRGAVAARADTDTTSTEVAEKPIPPASAEFSAAAATITALLAPVADVIDEHARRTRPYGLHRRRRRPRHRHATRQPGRGERRARPLRPVRVPGPHSATHGR